MTTFSVTPTSSIVPTSNGSAAGLEAQLARLKKELADSVNCASAKTTQGKVAIQELAGKVHDTESRIEKVGAEKSAPNSNAASARQGATPDSSISNGQLPANHSDHRSDSAPGRFVDTYA